METELAPWPPLRSIPMQRLTKRNVQYATKGWQRQRCTVANEIMWCSRVMRMVLGSSHESWGDVCNTKAGSGFAISVGRGVRHVQIVSLSINLSIYIYIYVSSNSNWQLNFYSQNNPNPITVQLRFDSTTVLFNFDVLSKFSFQFPLPIFLTRIALATEQWWHRPKNPASCKRLKSSGRRILVNFPWWFLSSGASAFPACSSSLWSVYNVSWLRLHLRV